ADKTSVDREKLLYLNGEILFHNYYAYTHEFQNEERQSIIDKWNKRGIRGQKRAIITLKEDRKSTRLNSSHVSTSYAVFCLKNKTTTKKIEQNKNKTLC